MVRPNGTLLAAFVGCFLVAASARAATQAHFWVGYAIMDDCSCGDVWPFDDPDPMYRMAIFDNTLGGTLEACADGCSNATAVSYDGVCGSDEDICGTWDFTDYQLDKTIPGNSTAYFYFGIFDDDTDESDLLGDHWLHPSVSETSASLESNNNGSPYYPDHHLASMCDGDVEGAGGADVWRLYHRIWYTDTTAPAVSNPSHTDDGLASTYSDNDTVLEFTWPAASDADTGIGGYRFNVSGFYANEAAPADRSISFCSSGCDYALTPVHGQTYGFQVGATNGNYPGITNAQTAWSSTTSVYVDLVDPVTAVAAPAASSWQRADFTGAFTDTDDGAGIDTCQWWIVSSGTTTRPSAARTCNGTYSASVGSAGHCRDQGVDTCSIEGNVRDLARRQSATGSRTFSIDWSEDTVSSLVVSAELGGVAISPSGWTADRDPYATFGIDTSARVAPIVGYSWAFDAHPDCVADIAGGDSQSVQTPAGSLDPGVHSFRVRAVDAAGNCGPIASHAIQVDDEPDAMGDLAVHSVPESLLIEAATWQPHNSVSVSWAIPASTAPIVEYAYGVDTAPDCIADTTSTSWALDAMGDAVHSLWVRAIDAAGNCGPESTYELWVDATADPIGDLTARLEPGGTVIPEDTWVADRDPYITWTPATSLSPIVGYSVAVDALPDCTVDQTDTAYDFAPGSLADGAHTFGVAALDAAGNCGVVASLSLLVKASPTAVVGPD
ncbi:MAG: Ig-like domain repeat protein, partial [Polyangiaceae bacterium]|nr:Ig-like domain repeat protein [Polyangiaceae bacterium]